MKLKEFYYKQLEGDLEFELGYLEYLREQSDLGTEELDEMEQEQKCPYSNSNKILSNRALNNINYQPKQGA